MSFFFTHSILSQKQRKFSATFTKESSNQMSKRLQGCPSNVTANKINQKLSPKICKTITFYIGDTFNKLGLCNKNGDSDNPLHLNFPCGLWMPPKCTSFFL